MQQEKVFLRNGEEVIGDYFDEKDYANFVDIFNSWINLTKIAKKMNGRGINIPDVLSEGLFCAEFNAVRTNNTAYSYDCVLIDTGEGVQIKSSSIENDCTSFGPTSDWDVLYFVDFAPNGNVDGKISFYKIDDFEIKSLILNKKKNETFEDQQRQGRRPRFSIKNEIIKPLKLKPVKKIDMYELSHLRVSTSEEDLKKPRTQTLRR